jgi:hypothetical protein
VNIGLAVVRGESVDALVPLAAALGLGALAYGVSILLDTYALRRLGAAREAAIFATAPFAGALLAVPLLGETWGLVETVSAAVMIVGVVLLVGDRHAHVHLHEVLGHEHPPGVDPAEPHSHPHRHEPLVHSHPHVSDAHHRHRHH